MMSSCVRCKRAEFIFGPLHDDTTGWQGWCQICNWKWHYSETKQVLVLVFRISAEPLRECIFSFLAGDTRTILCDSVHLRVWFPILLGNIKHMYVRNSTDDETYSRGEIREIDTDDETDSGVCDAWIDLVNPLHRCHLARPLEENDRWPWGAGKPLKIIARMLGKPSKELADFTKPKAKAMPCRKRHLPAKAMPRPNQRR